ncbi:enamine deaminase RidA (YjgF/YER057c/UK114 family) [Mesorhizobium soli]|uniref:RidA family protein n=1 Tax=Pseudaminobacter soli (ex Li et al. 2025) TaxID=1295366 RepID=UPI0024744C5D|nr:RidA family protein [Mesorhizobium soli]MDH6234601.1 enamine deaminase RidA (YjgF/YER057c/UK114 family) [Mesorhizobium soli]
MSSEFPSKSPVPQGQYLPATRLGNLIFTSGMTPRQDGALLFTGPVQVGEPVEYWREAVVLATRNALTAARNRLTAGEQIASVPSLSVFIAAEAGFTLHSRLADFASAFLHEELGEAGIGSRAAIGVATLPGNAPVEIQLIAAISG